MIHRYFEITVIHEESAFTVCEYFTDFGYWKSTNADYHRKQMVAGQMWHIFTNLTLTDDIMKNTIDALLEDGIGWSEVSLENASNPVSLRVPAMKGKRR
jgi:hypothetical protein